MLQQAANWLLYIYILKNDLDFTSLKGIKPMVRSILLQWQEAHTFFFTREATNCSQDSSLNELLRRLILGTGTAKCEDINVSTEYWGQHWRVNIEELNFTSDAW